MTEVEDDAFNKIKKDNDRLEQEEKAIRKAERDAIPKVTSKDISFVIDTICKEAKYDQASVRQLFFGMMTAFTKLGMGHKVNSKDSGAGKSYLTNKVASYFPDKHVLVLGGASNKAFQHKKGIMVVKDPETGELEPVEPIIQKKKDTLQQLDCNKKEDKTKIKDLVKEIEYLQNHAQKLIDLGDMIIIIQDTPQEGLLTNLMSLISQDSEKEQEYMFVQKEPLEGTSNIIRGIPVIFYTRVLDDTKHARAEEVFRRFVNVTPSATKEKIREAIKITFKRIGLLPEEYDEQVVSRKDKEKSRVIVSEIVTKLIEHSKYLGPKESGIKILFEAALAHAMPSDTVFEMTVSDRTARYLSIITKVHMDDRPRFVNKLTGAFYPVSTFEDLKETFGLMEMGGSNVRPYIVAMYNQVIFPLYSKIEEPRADKDEDGKVLARESYKGLRVQEIIIGTTDILGFTPSASEMYSKFLSPMVELGLINWVRSVLKGNEKIYFPSDANTAKVSTLFPDSSDLRLNVTDPALYPSKEVLEESYGFSSKLSWEEGGENNIFRTYQLLDSDGEEITVQELVERYLSNPELCFKPCWPQMKSYDAIKNETELKPEDNSSTIEPSPKTEFITCHDCGEVIPLFYVKIHQCEKKVYNNRNLTYATQILINHLLHSH